MRSSVRENAHRELTGQDTSQDGTIACTVKVNILAWCDANIFNATVRAVADGLGRSNAVGQLTTACVAAVATWVTSEQFRRPRDYHSPSHVGVLDMLVSKQILNVCAGSITLRGEIGIFRTNPLTNLQLNRPTTIPYRTAYTMLTSGVYANGRTKESQ
jgi:hypothetical protein